MVSGLPHRDASRWLPRDSNPDTVIAHLSQPAAAQPASLHAAVLSSSAAAATPALWPQDGYDAARTRRSPLKDPATGVSELWCYKFEDRIWSTSTVSAEGAVFVGSRDRNVCCMTPDGKVKWRFTAGAQFSASPGLSAGGLTVVNGSDDGVLHALAADTGAERWRTQLGSFNLRSVAFNASNGNLIVTASPSSVYALNAGRRC